MHVDSRRVQLEPAFVLHHRPFRDSSLLLDVLSERAGRVVLVARGARAARSRLKGLVRPFLPLRLSWVARGDLGTLTGAELDGRPIALTGEALLSGFYLNELLLYLLHRHDPQPDVFRAYQETVMQLAASGRTEIPLRQFELELLRLLGYAPVLGHEADSHRVLEPAASYEYRVDEGPARVQRTAGDLVFRGEELLAIGDGRFDDPEVLRAAGRLLRGILAHHLGGRELKSRKVLLDLRRRGVRIPAANNSDDNDNNDNNGETGQ